jgi:hypothetical protein
MSATNNARSTNEISRMRGVSMKTLLNSLIAVCAILSLAVSLHAGVPGLISYQGQLNDDSGTPVNGTIAITFSIYNVQTGGTALWTESQAVDVSNGVFSVQLGGNSPIPQSVYSDTSLYLGLQVGADPEMTPRQLLTPNYASHRTEILMPVGAIIAWHRDLPGTPPLTDAWAECNGQTLNDPQSPFDGQVLPDLNNEQRVLVGATTSGGVRDEDYVPPHTHGPGTLRFLNNSAAADDYYGGASCSGSVCGGATASTTAGTPLVGFEIVWVMRVK